MSGTPVSIVAVATAVAATVTVIVVVYCSLVVLMLTRPRVMSWFLFAHWLRGVPYFAPAPSASNLVYQRMASFARNISILTPDGALVRGWHILSPGRDAVRASEKATDSAARERLFDEVLGRCHVRDGKTRGSPELCTSITPRRVILFFHGNALDRSWPNRVAIVQFLAAHLGAQVLAIDPRGYGDSEGVPSEDGLAIDAESVYRWLCGEPSALPDLDDLCVLSPDTHLILYGQSLGTAVVTRLAEKLSEKGRAPRALILDAPFTSMPDALLDHPGAAPFRILPSLVWGRLISKLPDCFPTARRISRVGCPVLILHGTHDRKIGISQGRSLFKTAQAAGVKVQMREFFGAHHADCFAHPEYLAVLENFLANIGAPTGRPL